MATLHRHLFHVQVPAFVFVWSVAQSPVSRVDQTV